MAHIFTLANAKGGCGKTTVALNLAVSVTMAHELVLGPHLKRWRIRYAAAPGTREHADQACDRNKDERNLRHGQYHPIPPQACAYPWTFTSPIRQQATTQEADYAECDQLPWTDD